MYRTSVPVEIVYPDETVVDWEWLKTSNASWNDEINEALSEKIFEFASVVSSLIGPGPLLWRYNERDGGSNHRRLDSLLSHLFSADQAKHQSCESPAQKSSNTESVSTWWRHHDAHKLHIIPHLFTDVFDVL